MEIGGDEANYLQNVSSVNFFTIVYDLDRELDGSARRLTAVDGRTKVRGGEEKEGRNGRYTHTHVGYLYLHMVECVEITAEIIIFHGQDNNSILRRNRERKVKSEG